MSYVSVGAWYDSRTGVTYPGDAPAGNKYAVQLPPSSVPAASPSSFWAQLNRQAATMIAPIRGAIDAAPLSYTTKTVLKERPLDAVLDVFDPIEDAVGRAVDRVIARKGKQQLFFGKNVDITRVQAADRKTDASTQNLLRRLRTANAFIVLFFARPLELAEEMLNEGIDITGDALAAAGRAAGNVVKDVQEFFSGAYYSVGDPTGGTAEAGGAVGTTAVGGVSLQQVIDGAIAALIAAAAGVATDITKSAIKGELTSTPRMTSASSGGGNFTIPGIGPVPGAGTTGTKAGQPSSGGGPAPANGGNGLLLLGGAAAAIGLLLFLRK